MAQASIIIFLLYLQLLFAQVVYDRKSTSAISNDEELNPDSVVLPKLGEFFLNIDEAFSRLTAPKVEAEDRAKEQLYGRTQSARLDYIGRIRENYRNLQKRIGSSLGLTGDISILSDLFGINVKNKDGRSSVDVNLPFLPMKLSTSSKEVKDGPAFETSTTINEESVSETGVPEFTSNLKLGDIKINVDSKSSTESPGVQVEVETESLQPRASRQKLQKENEALSTESQYNKPTILNRKRLGQISKDTSNLASKKEMDEDEVAELPQTEDDSEISGRILGDLLYSESTFDKIMKRVIKDSKWFLDSDLSPTKVFQRINKFTQNIAQRREGSSELSKNDLDDQELSSSTLPSIPEDEEIIESSSESEEMPTESVQPMQYEVDDVTTNQDGIQLTFVPHPGSELNLESLYGEDILLAFTPQGVPLKLKMPPEVEDPLQFLHDTLRAADVSLNIPVETYEDIVPVGRDVLQLGSRISGSGGLMAQTLYVDLSDYDQMKSLLKILRKFTSSRDQRL